MGEGLVVEGAVSPPSSIGGDGADEAFFDGDADTTIVLIGFTCPARPS